MYMAVLIVHILVCLFLIAIVLLQGGRGGLAESLGGAAAQSLFGSSATTVLTKLTTFCAAIFVVTCLSLAYLSTATGRSVIEQIPTGFPASLPIAPATGIPEPLMPPVSSPVTSTPPVSQPASAPQAATPSETPVSH